MVAHSARKPLPIMAVPLLTVLARDTPATLGAADGDVTLGGGLIAIPARDIGDVNLSAFPLAMAALDHLHGRLLSRRAGDARPGVRSAGGWRRLPGVPGPGAGPSRDRPRTPPAEHCRPARV